MPLINFSGIASGIDSNALIDATSEVARQTRIVPLERKIKETQDANTALTSLQSKMQKLKDVLFKFSASQGGPLQKRATSSDETVVSASAATSALNGTYTVTVNSLARSATWTMENSATSTVVYTSTESAINPQMVAPGTVAVQLGATGQNPVTFNLNVTSTTTLSQFVTEFNNQSAGRATASVVNIGSPTSPNYRVVINGLNTGLAQGSITITPSSEITDPDGVPANGDEAWDDLSGAVQASDSNFDISGVAEGIQRSTNSISDVIPGLTFNLKDDDGGDAIITVSDDSSGTATKIQEFISAYNDVIGFVKENDTVTSEEQGSNILNQFGPLAKTSLDNSAISVMRSMLSDSLYFNTGNFETATNRIRVLADLGIKTDRNPYNATTKTGGGTLIFTTSSTIVDEFTLTKAISEDPTSVNEILKKLGNLGGTQDGRLTQFVQFQGLIEKAISANKEVIKDLNSRIGLAETAIAKQEETMRARFARLEAVIGRMQNQQSSLASAISSLPRAR